MDASQAVIFDVLEVFLYIVSYMTHFLYNLGKFSNMSRKMQLVNGAIHFTICHHRADTITTFEKLIVNLELAV